MPTFQLTADDHLLDCVNSMYLENRLRYVETNRCNRLHGSLPQIVGTSGCTVLLLFSRKAHYFYHLYRNSLIRLTGRRFGIRLASPSPCSSGLVRHRPCKQVALPDIAA